MRSHLQPWEVFAAGAITAIVMVQAAPPAIALPASEVGKIAKQITVKIDGQNSGSGILIRQDGNNYYVLTARHVVGTKDEYTVVTPDGKRYPVNYSTVKPFPGVDLAILQFTSGDRYAIAQMGNSQQTKEGVDIYVAGFPYATTAINQSLYQFTTGRVTANANRPLADGYALVYSNNTLPGMSGGPVLDDKGEVVGVHGRADTAENEKTVNEGIRVKTGFNLGIPISTFLRLATPDRSRVTANPKPVVPSTQLIAADYFLEGGFKLKKQDWQGAIAAFSAAIRLNPNYAEAYNNLGVTLARQGKTAEAIAAYQKAISINPNFAMTYNNLGVALANQGKTAEAIAAYQKVISLNPNHAVAYNNLGFALDDQGKIAEAIAAYQKVISLNPNYAEAYNNLGAILYRQGKTAEAIANTRKAISINPNFTEAYNNLGVTLWKQGKTAEAIANFKKAVDLYRAQGETQQADNLIRQLKQVGIRW